MRGTVQATPRGPLRRALRTAGTGLAILLLSLALLEAGLQAASLFASDRASVWRPDAPSRILCVGDSHTWGSSVSRDESYPAQLQQILDEREPGRHSVVNQGLPGMNSEQVRNRLPVWLQRSRPTTVVVWVGVNNAWNRAELETDAGRLRSWLDAALIRSRVYRLVRVWLHDRDLARYAPEGRSARRWHKAEAEDELGPEPRYTVRHDGVVEEIRHERDPLLLEKQGEERVRARVERDLELVAEHAQAAGVDLIFITYPIEHGWADLANQALLAVAERHHIPVVRSRRSAHRLPKEKRDWLPDGHPGPHIYHQIARDLAPLITGGRQ